MINNEKIYDRMHFCSLEINFHVPMAFYGSLSCGSVTLGTGADLRIRTTDLRIRIQLKIRILLFSSVADKIPTTKSFFQSFFANYFLKARVHEFS